MAFIVDMCLDKLVEHYRLYMQDALDADDPIRADIVKKGLLQEQKIENNIQIGVQGGDHENPDDLDGIVTLDKLPNIGIIIPEREVGGGQIWMRRGVIRLECFWVAEGLDEDAAHRDSYNCLGKVMSLVENTPVNGLVDDYGERALQIFCYANTFFETGGPPASYIFRGKISWAVFTERP